MLSSFLFSDCKGLIISMFLTSETRSCKQDSIRDFLGRPSRFYGIGSDIEKHPQNKGPSSVLLSSFRTKRTVLLNMTTFRQQNNKPSPCPLQQINRNRKVDARFN